MCHLVWRITWRAGSRASHRWLTHSAVLCHLQEKPPAVEDMLSWNTLTPHYEEDVIYALNSKNLAKHLNMEPGTTAVRPQPRSVHMALG